MGTAKSAGCAWGCTVSALERMTNRERAGAKLKGTLET